jgi:hypothetical protein
VEFTLSPIGNTTKISITEVGFENLPAMIIHRKYFFYEFWREEQINNIKEYAESK